MYALELRAHEKGTPKGGLICLGTLGILFAKPRNQPLTA
jgi:hypothetical protein